MALQLPSVVIARQIEIIQARHHAVIDDPDDIGLLHVLGHAIDGGAVLTQGWGTETLTITLHHLGQIEIHLVAGTVLNERQAVAVANLAADRRNTHGGLRAAANLRRPLCAMCHLDPPKPEAKRAHPQQHQQSQKLDPQTWIQLAPVHSRWLLSGKYG